MIKDEIEMNALLIRQHLVETGECSVAQLKNNLNLKDKEIDLAIGWIAKDESVFLFKRDNILYIDIEFD